MKTQKAEIKIQTPKSVHIIAWNSPKISYRIVKGSKTLLSCNQGFERVSGLEKNIRAVAELFLTLESARDLTIYWTLNRSSKVILKQTTVTV